jgi:hypothetical protein
MVKRQRSHAFSIYHLPFSMQAVLFQRHARHRAKYGGQAEQPGALEGSIHHGEVRGGVRGDGSVHASRGSGLGIRRLAPCRSLLARWDGLSSHCRVVSVARRTPSRVRAEPAQPGSSGPELVAGLRDRSSDTDSQVVRGSGLVRHHRMVRRQPDGRVPRAGRATDCRRRHESSNTG